MSAYEINPFDIVSGKVVQNEWGIFWFKDAGNNMLTDGAPIIKNLHRDNGLPAVVRHDRSQMWWYKDGNQHREDRPAYISNDDIKEWWMDGKLHNLNGPAVILNGTVRWYINGVRFSEEGFNEHVRTNKPI